MSPAKRLQHHDMVGCLTVTRIQNWRRIAANEFAFDILFTADDSGEICRALSERWQNLPQQPFPAPDTRNIQGVFEDSQAVASTYSRQKKGPTAEDWTSDLPAAYDHRMKIIVPCALTLAAALAGCVTGSHVPDNYAGRIRTQVPAEEVAVCIERSLATGRVMSKEGIVIDVPNRRMARRYIVSADRYETVVGIEGRIPEESVSDAAAIKCASPVTSG